MNDAALFHLPIPFHKLGALMCLVASGSKLARVSVVEGKAESAPFRFSRFGICATGAVFHMMAVMSHTYLMVLEWNSANRLTQAVPLFDVDQ